MRRALAILGVLALAGCGGSDDTTGGTGEDVAKVTKPATGSVAYESWTPTQQTMDAIVAAFEKENPSVEVTVKLAAQEDYLTSLKTQLAAGGGPDVFVVPPGAYFNQFRSFMTPLDEFAARSLGSDWKGRFRRETIARSTVGGRTYGLPSGYTAAGLMWVNRSLLRRFDLPVPRTYEQLREAAATLRRHGLSALALGAKDAWQNVDYFMAIANAGGARGPLYAAMEGRGRWTDPALVSAFERWRRLFEDGVLQEGALGAATYNDTYDLFLDQKAAFLANGSWNLDMFTNSAEKIGRFDVGIAGFPAPGGSGPAPVTADVDAVVAVNRRSKNKAAAYKLAEFMSVGAGSQTLMNAFLYFPVQSRPLEPTVDLADDAAAARRQIGRLVDAAAGYRQVPSAAVNEALGQALAGVAAGRLSPSDAAGQVQEAAERE